MTSLMIQARRFFTAPPPAAQYIIAVAAVIVISLASSVTAGEVGYLSVSLVLLLTVAVLSLTLNVGPVLAAATISALIWNFFFIPPRYTFAITHPEDALMFAAYFVISAITGILTTRIRAREKMATSLYSLTKELIGASSPDDVALAAIRNVSAMLDAQVVLYLSTIDGEIGTTPHPASTFPANTREFRVASWAYWNEKKAGKFFDVLPFAQCTYYPISGPRYPLGVIGIKRRNGKPLTVEREALLQNFIAQIASSLEREQLNELAKRTIVYAESEKLYRTLFNSISHELRTPIAAIIGAAEALPPQRNADLVGEIRTGAERLNRLVENLLDMTRLESGQLAPKRDWCDLHDLFRSSVQKLKGELAQHALSIDLQDDMPFVRLDFVLMEQVLMNLLYNASVYTPAGTRITLSASITQELLRISVSDNGPGIPESSLPHLFHKFYRVPGSKAGGTGLGLSIAKGFVEAHKGTIAAHNGKQGGAEFIMMIPTETHSQQE